MPTMRGCFGVVYHLRGCEDPRDVHLSFVFEATESLMEDYSSGRRSSSGRSMSGGRPSSALGSSLMGLGATDGARDGGS